MSQELSSTSPAGTTLPAAGPVTIPTGIDNALASIVKVYVNSLVKEKSSNKRPHEEDSLPEKNFQTCGRMYGRQGDPFLKVDAIVNFGLKHETTEEPDENLEEEQQELKPQEKRLLHSWKLLCTTIPDFCVQMLALASLRGLRKTTCQHIQDGASTARSDDTNSLKASIPSYILFDTTKSLSPPISQRNKLRNDRGFYHLETGSLLCPVKYANVPETYASIRAGRLPISATMLPRFLFPHDHVHNPSDIAKDIFRGHVMLRAAKHILQGPTSALEGPGAHRGKQGNAAICGITTLTPNLIAYIATQVRFALSSTPTWTTKDGSFSYQDFYRHIVELLSDGDDDTAEIITLYNHHVFGAQDPADTNPDAAEAEDEYALIKKQRALKRTRTESAT